MATSALEIFRPRNLRKSFVVALAAAEEIWLVSEQKPCFRFSENKKHFLASVFCHGFDVCELFNQGIHISNGSVWSENVFR